MRRELPMIVAFVAGLILILQFFIPALRDVSESVQNWVIVVAAFAIAVGAFNLLRVNYMKIRFRRADWPFSVVLIAGFVVMVVVGLSGLDFVREGGSAVPAAVGAPTAATAAAGAPTAGTAVAVAAAPRGALTVKLGQGIEVGTVFDWLFTYLMFPMSGTMFALLAFFVASAAYRAFRARTVEATLLLVSAFIVMLGQVPLGSFWVPAWWPFFLTPDWLKDKIMEIGNTAGQRAILIGASLGVVSTSLRILLGIERSYLGEE